MAGDARLFVLATLDRLGEAHGHEVTREAALDRTENWAHVSQGALYSALRRCETDGLIAPVRTEQIGRFPARTVYRLTETGRDVLARTRSEAWRRIGIPPDPFDLALSVADGHDPAELRTAIEHRLAQYVDALHGLGSEFDVLRPRLEPTAVAVFEHVMLRYETEIAWHRRLLEQVDTFAVRRQHQPEDTS
jgi:DNA-binding PadR family transcriptional regulator